jgi:hypothetical protein
MMAIKQHLKLKTPRTLAMQNQITITHGKSKASYAPTKAKHHKLKSIMHKSNSLASHPIVSAIVKHVQMAKEFKR